MRARSLGPLTLQLVQKGDIFIELHEAKEGDEAAHDSLLEVDLNSERLLDGLRVEDFALLLCELVIVGHLDSEGILVGIVVQVDEAIVEKEARVALFAVRVVDLFTALDVFQSFDDEALSVVRVGPARLPWSLVVQHICVGNESVGLDTLNLDAKDATGDHHTDLRVFFQAELAIVGHFIANRVIVLLDISNFLRDLVLEGASLEPGALLLRVEDRKVVEGLR